MSTLTQFLQAVEKLDFKKAVTTAIEETKDEFLQLNKGQLRHGLNAEGEPMPKYRSAAYARKKHALNPLAGLGITDLSLTGDWQQGLSLDLQGSALVFGSTDSKDLAISTKYKNIYGLGPVSREEWFSNHFNPALFNHLIKQTQLPFKIK